mgnify:CR=1 FL=1|jgi:hypothetical protein
MFHLPPRRRAILLFVAAATAAFPGPVVAQAKSTLTRAAQSLLVGRWELDLTRMPDGYGPPPRRVVYDFQDTGGGRSRLTVDVTAPDESVRHMVLTYRPDGIAAYGEADTSEADSAAILTPAPNVLVMNLAKDKRPASVRVYTVSTDGKNMTESAAAINERGEPVIRTFYYRRLH